MLFVRIPHRWLCFRPKSFDAQLVSLIRGKVCRWRPALPTAKGSWAKLVESSLLRSHGRLSFTNRTIGSAMSRSQSLPPAAYRHLGMTMSIFVTDITGKKISLEVLLSDSIASVSGQLSDDNIEKMAYLFEAAMEGVPKQEARGPSRPALRHEVGACAQAPRSLDFACGVIWPKGRGWLHELGAQLCHLLSTLSHLYSLIEPSAFEHRNRITIHSKRLSCRRHLPTRNGARAPLQKVDRARAACRRTNID